MIDLFFKPNFKGGWYVPSSTTYCSGNTDVYSDSAETGYSVVVNYNCYLLSVDKNPASGRTVCKLHNSSHAVIETANFVGNTATFSGTSKLVVGSTYYIKCSVGSATRKFFNIYKYGTNINLWEGVRGTGADNYGYDMESVTTIRSKD